MLTGPMLPDSAGQVDRRTLRAKEYSDKSRSLLEHVWALTGARAEVPHGDTRVVAAASAGRRRSRQAVRDR